MKIGRLTDISVEKARDRANTLKAEITLGSDPRTEAKKLRNQPTFTEVFEHYYREHAQKFNKRADDYKRVAELHLLPVLGKKKSYAITRPEMTRLHTCIAEQSGKTAANKAIATASAIFNFGIRSDFYTGSNPCIGVQKFKPTKRDRFLTKDELTAFFTALESETDLFKDYFQILLYTGARKTNVMAMKWADVSLDLGQWRIVESEAKNAEINIVNLPDLAMQILYRRFENNKKSNIPSVFVFPGEGKTGHLVDPKKALNRVRKRMQVSNFTIHDLRRTLGSYMAISGASLRVIGEALNHKSYVSTEIYARLSKDPVLDALNVATTVMRQNKTIPLFRANANFVQTRHNTFYTFTELAA